MEKKTPFSYSVICFVADLVIISSASVSVLLETVIVSPGRIVRTSSASVSTVGVGSGSAMDA